MANNYLEYGIFYVPTAELATFQDSIEAILNSTNRAMLRGTKNVASVDYNLCLMPVFNGHKPSWKTALAAVGGHGYFVDGRNLLADATTPSAQQQFGAGWSRAAAESDIGAQQGDLVLFIDDSLSAYTDAYDPDASVGSRHTGGSFEAFPSLGAAYAAMSAYRRTEFILRDNGNRNYIRYSPTWDWQIPATKPVTLRSYTEVDEWATVSYHPDDHAYFNDDPDLVFTSVPLIRVNANGCIFEDFSLIGAGELGMEGRYDHNDIGIGSWSSDPIVYDTIARRLKISYSRHCAFKGALYGLLVEQCVFKDIGGQTFDHILYMTAQPDINRPLIMRWNFAQQVAGEFLRGVVDASTDYYYEVYGNVIDKCSTGGIEVGNYGWGKIANNSILHTHTTDAPAQTNLPSTWALRIAGRIGVQTQIIVNNLVALGDPFQSFEIGNSNGWRDVYGTLGDNWLQQPVRKYPNLITEEEFYAHWHGDQTDHVGEYNGDFDPDFADPDGTNAEDYALETPLDAGRDASSLIPDIRLLDAALTASNGYPTPEESYSASSVGAFAVSA